MKTTPRVGEIVLFSPNPDDQIAKSNHNEEPIPAIITRVWGPNCVNLKIIPDCGPMQDRTSVVHESENPSGYHFKYILYDGVKDSMDTMISLNYDEYESRLVSFGNFLLKRHSVRDVSGEKAEVTHADLENWKGI